MRPIEALPKIYSPANHGPVPELRWLAVSSLVVDESYQRPIESAGRSNIRKIAAEFSWIKFAPVVVCPIAGGHYAIVDGQHRATAAFSVGIDSVPCLIIQADRQQQAASFQAINGAVTRMNRLQLFKSALAAGSPEALVIHDAATKAGVTIVKGCVAAKDLKPGETMACGTIGICVAKYGMDQTIVALRAVRASEGEIGGALQAKIIFAAATVLSDHAEWRADRRLFEAFEAIDLCDAAKAATVEASRRKGLKSSDLLEAEIVTHLDRFLTKKAVA